MDKESARVRVVKSDGPGVTLFTLIKPAFKLRKPSVEVCATGRFGFWGSEDVR